MANGQEGGGNGAVIAVLVVVVVALAAWFAYNQGYIGGSKNNQQDIEINLPGSSSNPSPTPRY